MIRVAAVTLALLLAACERSPEAMKEVQALKVGEAPAATVGAAQIAYAYRIGYRLPAAAIAAVQTRHTALCDAMGRARCRIEESSRQADEGRVTTARLTLRVDAADATAFEERLNAVAADAGGDTTNREVTGEDLSKAMIDTGARIRAKQALADRLLAIIKTRGGSVADLVAAERAFADAQQELDAARTEMAEMQGRVAMSKVDIGYEATGSLGRGLMAPIRDALEGAGDTLGSSVGVLIAVVVAALPWLLVALALRWLFRRLGWRIHWRWRRRGQAVKTDQPV